MRKILLGLLVTGTLGAVVWATTNAFFSDTETSTGNILQAGEIDLKIDNQSYIDQGTGLVESPGTTWGLQGGQDDPLGLFFNFTDLKPGDLGEDTISIHLSSNPAWLCADLAITANSDETCTEPENAAVGGENNDCVVENNGTNGDLAGQLNFVFWEDDGDNVLEVDERILTQGPASNVLNGVTWALADSQTGDNQPLQPGVTYIGKAWCFGTLTTNPLANDDTSPLVRGNSVLCDGSQVNNTAQTDKLMGDISFRAVQSRHNLDFVCRPLDQQRPLVGAALGTYDDPASCDATVSGGSSIQTAINSAVDGNTICVDPTYTGVGDTYPVNVDKDLTIAGLGAMGDANIPGGFFISDSGVTITGLEFTNYSFIQASENAAVYIHNEVGVSGVALANTTIDHNIFTAPGGAKAALAKGVVTEIGSGAAPQATGIDVLHNVFNGWRQAMFFNTTDEYEVAFNDILNNDVGVANDGPHNGSIHNNDFESNVLEAVGVAPSATNGTGNNGLLTVNTNNFTPAGAGNDVNWYGSSVLGGADVNAENNFWSGEADAARTNDTSEVDTNPFEAVAFPEN